MKYLSLVSLHQVMRIFACMTTCFFLCACPSAQEEDVHSRHILQEQCLSHCSNDEVWERASTWEADSNYYSARYACSAPAAYNSCSAQINHFELLLATPDAPYGFDGDLSRVHDALQGDAERFNSVLVELHEVPSDLRRSFTYAILEACEDEQAAICMMGDGEDQIGWIARYRHVIQGMTSTDAQRLLLTAVSQHIDVLSQQQPQRRADLAGKMSALQLNETDIAQLRQMTKADIESLLMLAYAVHQNTNSTKRDGFAVARRVGAAAKQQAVARQLQTRYCTHLDAFAEHADAILKRDASLFANLCIGMSEQQQAIFNMPQANPPAKPSIIYTLLAASWSLGTRFTAAQYVGLLDDLPTDEVEPMVNTLAALSHRLNDSASPVYQALYDVPAQQRLALARGINNGIGWSNYSATGMSRLIRALQGSDSTMVRDVTNGLVQMQLVETAPTSVIAMLRDMHPSERDVFLPQAHSLATQLYLTDEQRAEAMLSFSRVQSADRNALLTYVTRRDRSRGGLREALRYVDDSGHFAAPPPTRAEIARHDALAHVVAFWQSIAEGTSVAALAAMPITESVRAHSNPQQEERLQALSEQLRHARDFASGGTTRRLLALRFVRMLRAIGASETVAASYHAALAGQVTCSDQAVLLMNQMEMQLQVHEAENADNPENALYNLARAFVRLEEIHRHADNKIVALRWSRHVDEIEVYLAYETALVNRLTLPVSTQDMLYRAISGVSAQDIERAYNDALRAGNDPVRINAYLSRWEPWQKLLRVRFAERTTWAMLPQAPPEALESLAPDEICIYTQECITDLLCDETAELVIVRGPTTAHGQVWRAFDYDMFMHEWAQKGTDPVSRQPIAEQHIYRLQR